MNNVTGVTGFSDYIYIDHGADARRDWISLFINYLCSFSDGSAGDSTIEGGTTRGAASPYLTFVGMILLVVAIPIN
jgi:hypothetical protein